MTDLRVAVLGVGIMGADHVRRLATLTSGARPVVVADAFTARAHEVAATVPGLRVVDDPFDAIADPEVDAVVIATPGPTHEKLVLACLDRAVPVLCEKPLTTDAETALAVVRAEQALLAEGGHPLVQVGFMRRFDAEYVALKALVDAGEVGSPLLVHCAHRNASVAPGFTSEMMINDSVVHEADVVRFLLDEEITAVTVLAGRPSAVAPAGLADPQLVLFETAGGRLVDVEIFVTAQVGYQVRTEVVGERGSAMIGLDAGLVSTTATAGGGRRGGRVSADFRERFAAAYDTEFQRWVDAARLGTIDGPGAWDGYAAAAVCAAGVQALRTGRRVEVGLAARVEAAA